MRLAPVSSLRLYSFHWPYNAQSVQVTQPGVYSPPAINSSEHPSVNRYNECVETRRMCPNCRAFIPTSDKVCPYCHINLQAPAIARRAPSDMLGGLLHHAHFTTIVILLINAGFYLAEALPGLISGSGATGLPLFQAGAKYGPAIQDGQWWRLLTAGFLHGGILHLLMNSWVLFDLGAATEESYGTNRFLVIYVLSTITGFYASYLWTVSYT